MRKTMFGCWTGFDSAANTAESFDDRVARCQALFGGKIAAERYFQESGFANWPQYYATNRASILSFNQSATSIAAGTFDAQILAWLRALDTGPDAPTFYTTPLHEPDAGSPINPADFVACFQHFSGLVLTVRSEGHTNILRSPIFTNFQLAHPTPPTGWLQWYPGDEFVDAIGWDCYWNSDGRSTAETCYGPAYQLCLDHGKAMIVPETGFKQPYANGAVLTEAQWASNVADAIAFLDGKAKAVCWFESNKADGDWRLAPHPAALAEWKTAVVNSYL
jgi:hypothetical protein